MKKKFLIVAILVAISSFYSFNAKGIAIGITFHVPGDKNGNGGPSDKLLQDFVCTINAIYKDHPGSPNMGFVFYLEPVKRVPTSWGINPSLAVQNSPKQGVLNIYKSTTDKYDASNDIVMLASISTTALTQDAVTAAHEIGHFLGLRHPAGPNGTPPFFTGCACSSGGGDPDCVSDTPPAPSGNLMDQGSNISCIWTPGQQARAASCFASRGLTLPGQGALHELIYNNIMPLDYINVDPTLVSAVKIDWEYPSDDCPNVNYPERVDIFVTTGCPAIGIQQYSFTSIFYPVHVSSFYGITSIRIVYYYPGSIATNQVIRNKYFPHHHTAACEDTGWPNSKPGKSITSITDTEQEEASFYIVNAITSENIKIINSGFKSGNIYNMSGQSIRSITYTDGVNDLNITDLPSGIYILTAAGDNKLIRRKIVRQ